jgi:hypothetical protein
MIRDTFVGHNENVQNPKKALKLAAVCTHPDAVWLTTLFAGREVQTRDEAEKLFLACGESDGRALCFAAACSESGDFGKAARMGYPFAQAMAAWTARGFERLEWAQKAAAQGERNGFLWLGACHRDGDGCNKDLEKAKENFLMAATLGHVNSMTALVMLLDVSDVQRYVWLERLAKVRHDRIVFWDSVTSVMAQFGNRQELLDVVFVIGRALNGHIDNEKKTIFGSAVSFFDRIGPANLSVRFYTFQLQSYRKAVDTWTLVGLRNGVVKDIRKFIGNMIWEARREAKYVE